VEPDTITLDSYGYLFKPWDDVPSLYYDVAYWRMAFHDLMKAHRKSAKHPRLQAAFLVADACRLKGRVCTRLLAEGLQGMACLNARTKVVTKYSTGPGDAEAWRDTMAVLDKRLPAHVRPMCILPDLASLRSVFVAATHTVYLVYTMPFAGKHFVPFDEGPAANHEAALQDLQAWLAATKSIGTFHGDLHAGNVLISTVPDAPRPVIRIIDWERVTPKPRDFEASGDARGLLRSLKGGRGATPNGKQK
jgi:hypothetical protein